jgi:type II secretory ATPase GspE/PulE/Tfp pilus assembly ATPase PilB-like protein
MTTLRENAIKKLAQGETSFEEVLRMTVEAP